MKIEVITFWQSKDNYGYEYLNAGSKDEFLLSMDRFLSPVITEKPMIFEVFTDTENESKAIEIMRTFLTDGKTMFRNKIVGSVRAVIGKNGII